MDFKKLLETAFNVFENSQGVYDYSNFQVNIPSDIAGSIIEFSNNILDDCIYEDPNDPSYGREDEPHITVRYGANISSPEDLVLGNLIDLVPHIRARFGKISIFDSEEYDVLKIDVESEDLKKLNSLIGKMCKFPGETHKEYHPHVTIAYLKKGCAKNYIGDETFNGIELEFDTMYLNSKNGKKYPIKLETINAL